MNQVIEDAIDDILGFLAGIEAALNPGESGQSEIGTDRNADLLRALFVAVAGGNWGAAEDALRNIASWAEGEELSALATCAEVRRAREQREADRAAFDAQQVIFAARRAELDALDAELDARIAARAAQAASL